VEGAAERAVKKAGVGSAERDELKDGVPPVDGPADPTVRKGTMKRGDISNDGM